MERNHLQQQAPWMTHPDVTQKLKNPSVHPGGPPAVSGSAVSSRHRVAEFGKQAASTLADLTAHVEQALAQHAGTQLSHQQLAAAVDASDLRMPFVSPAARQSAALHPLQDSSSQVNQPAATPCLTAVAAAQAQTQAATAMQSGRAAPTSQLLVQQQQQTLLGLQQQQQQQQQQQMGQLQQQWQTGRPASCIQLDSYQEVAVQRDTYLQVGAGLGAKSGSAAALTAGRSNATGSCSNADQLVPGQDVIVTLHVFESGRKTDKSKQILQEIQVLGSTSLAELRDAVCCPLDRLAEGLGLAHGAAYLYLGNTFYDDTRASSSADCSELVQKWAAAAGMIAPRALHYEAAQAEQHRQQQQQQSALAGVNANQLQQLGMLPQQHQQQDQQPAAEIATTTDVQQQQTGAVEQQQQQQRVTRAMQDTCISDVVLQVSNRPMGLYSHQGCCEHQVMVADVRLLHPSDPQWRSGYPRTLRSMSLAKRYSCGLCKRQGALMLLLHHPEAPEEVIMLCDRCEKLFDVGRYKTSRKLSLAD